MVKLDELKSDLDRIQSQMYHLGKKDCLTSILLVIEHMPEMNKPALIDFLREVIRVSNEICND